MTRLYIVIFHLQLLIGVLFFTTAINKLQNISRHISIINSYEILPSQFSKIFLICDCLIQLSICVSLILGWNVFIFSIIACILLLVYTLAIIINLSRKNKINCGCGGLIGDHQISWKMVYRNVLLGIFIVIIGQFAKGVDFNKETLYIWMNVIVICSFILLSTTYRSIVTKLNILFKERI